MSAVPPLRASTCRTSLDATNWRPSKPFASGMASWSRTEDTSRGNARAYTGTNPVITGTFRHLAPHVIDVHIAGSDDPIGCTPQHPFWSETRDDFVPASALEVGEEVLTAYGNSARITTIVPRAGPQTVYGLEVYGEHVYHVGEDALLAHNASSGQRYTINQMKGRYGAYRKSGGTVSWKQYLARNNHRLGFSRATKAAGYADDDLANVALRHRKRHNLGRSGNVAVVEYELKGVTRTRAFDTVGKGGKHSEFVARDRLPKGANVKRLFTERQPCQLAIPNCDRMLARDFPSAKITYLVEWGNQASRTRGNKALDILLRGEGL